VRARAETRLTIITDLSNHEPSTAQPVSIITDLSNHAPSTAQPVAVTHRWEKVHEILTWFLVWSPAVAINALTSVSLVCNLSPRTSPPEPLVPNPHSLTSNN
jgi:hypothetical protein